VCCDSENGARAHSREVSVHPDAVPDHVHDDCERGAADQEDDLVEKTRTQQGGDQGRTQRSHDADVARRVLDPGNARRTPQRDRRDEQTRGRHQALVPSDEERERQHATRRRGDDARERGVRRGIAPSFPEDVAQRNPLRERAIHMVHQGPLPRRCLLFFRPCKLTGVDLPPSPRRPQRRWVGSCAVRGPLLRGSRGRPLKDKTVTLSEFS
jgi:hypothetical protein